MYIYVDQKNGNKIEAIYSGKPKSKTWIDRGYTLVEIPNDWNPTQEDSIELDPEGNPLSLKKNTHPLPAPEPVINSLKGLEYDALSDTDKDKALKKLFEKAGLLDDSGTFL